MRSRDIIQSVMSAFLTVGTRQLNDLTNQVQIYNGLLRDILPELDNLSAQKVEQVLNEVSNPPRWIFETGMPTW